MQEHLLNVSKQLCVFVIVTALENIFWKNDITTSYSLKDPFCSLVKVFLVFFFSHLVVWVVVFCLFHLKFFIILRFKTFQSLRVRLLKFIWEENSADILISNRNEMLDCILNIAYIYSASWVSVALLRGLRVVFFFSLFHLLFSFIFYLFLFPLFFRQPCFALAFCLPLSKHQKCKK